MAPSSQAAAATAARIHKTGIGIGWLAVVDFSGGTLSTGLIDYSSGRFLVQIQGGGRSGTPPVQNPHFHSRASTAVFDALSRSGARSLKFS